MPQDLACSCENSAGRVLVIFLVNLVFHQDYARDFRFGNSLRIWGLELDDL